LPLPVVSAAGELGSLSIAIQTTLPAARSARDTAERRFARAVLGRYLWLPDTPARTSRYDRQLAQGWYAWSEGQLVLVEEALLLTATRRALREAWLPPLPQVRSLAYFQNSVREALANTHPVDLDYLNCLLRRLRPLAERKQTRLHPQLDAPAKWGVR
jgi:hypothetical protein